MCLALKTPTQLDMQSICRLMSTFKMISFFFINIKFSIVLLLLKELKHKKFQLMNIFNLTLNRKSLIILKLL